MTSSFDSIETAFAILGDPGNPRWAEAFSFLAMEPDTGQLVIEAFRETLEQMGVEPTGTDATSGEPAYALADIAGAMGVSAEDLEAAMTSFRPEADPLE